MRVVVSGGAGFLGSHVCRALLGRGDEVVCIDNLVTGVEDNISALIGSDRFTFIRHDVSNHVIVDGHVDAVMVAFVALALAAAVRCRRTQRPAATGARSAVA